MKRIGCQLSLKKSVIPINDTSTAITGHFQLREGKNI